MTTAASRLRTDHASPLTTARIVGAFYLLTIATRMLVEIFVRNRFIVSDDAAATAANVLAHEPLFRLGFAADMVAFASYVVLTALLYGLLKPVNRSVSLVAAFLSLVACAVQALSSVFYLIPVVLLKKSPYTNAFTREQLQALVLVFFSLRAMCYHNIGLVFFGLYCLLIGYLILMSAFLPRVIGALMMLAGCSYANFVSPPLVAQLQPYILVFPAVGQISLTLWLLVIGVNAQRWTEQAGRAQFSR